MRLSYGLHLSQACGPHAYGTHMLERGALLGRAHKIPSPWLGANHSSQ